MTDGWIKIYPKMTEWRWYRDTYTKAIFLHLLLSANFKDTPYKDTTVKRGQVLTSISRLSKELDIPVITIRRKLDNLKKSGEMVCETTNKGTIITICNYDSYQGSAKTDEQANEQTDEQTNEQAYNKKNIRNKDIYPPSLSKERVSPLKDRQQKFYDSLIPFVEKYGKEMIRKFYDYWSEPNRSMTKMKCEKQETWSLERRLATWHEKEMDFKPQQHQQSKPSKFDQYKQVAIQLGLYHDGTEQSDSIDEQ